MEYCLIFNSNLIGIFLPINIRALQYNLLRNENRKTKYNNKSP